MARAMLSKSLTQFSVDEPGCVPFLLLDLRPNYGGGNEDNGNLLQKVRCMHCFASNPEAGHRRPMPLPETPGHSWASLGQPLVESLLLSPWSWCIQGSVCALQESVSPVLCKFWWLYSGAKGNLLQKVAIIFINSNTQWPQPCSWPPLTPASTGDSWILMGKSGSVSFGVTAPFFWVLVNTRFCLCPPRVCFPSPV